MKVSTFYVSVSYEREFGLYEVDSITLEVAVRRYLDELKDKKHISKYNLELGVVR